MSRRADKKDKAKTVGADSRDDLTTFDTTRARIPDYDPSGDKYCPSAHTTQYRRRQREVQRRVRQDQLSKTAPGRQQQGRAKTPRRLEPVTEPTTGPRPHARAADKAAAVPAGRGFAADELYAVDAYRAASPTAAPHLLFLRVIHYRTRSAYDL